MIIAIFNKTLHQESETFCSDFYSSEFECLNRAWGEFRSMLQGKK